jgi:hypothetical protein
MAYVLVRHRVNDFALWRKAFEDALETRREGGEVSFRIMNGVADPLLVVGLFEWDSVENAKVFFDSSGLKSKMEAAGVAEQPEIYFLENVLQG